MNVHLSRTLIIYIYIVIGNHETRKALHDAHQPVISRYPLHNLASIYKMVSESTKLEIVCWYNVHNKSSVKLSVRTYSKYTLNTKTGPSWNKTQTHQVNGWLDRCPDRQWTGSPNWTRKRLCEISFHMLSKYSCVLMLSYRYLYMFSGASQKLLLRG